MGFRDIKISKGCWERKQSKSRSRRKTSHKSSDISTPAHPRYKEAHYLHRSQHTHHTPRRPSHIRYISPLDPNAKPSHPIPASVGPSLVEAPPSYGSFYTEAHISNSPPPTYANSTANEAMAQYNSPRQRPPQRGPQAASPTARIPPYYDSQARRHDDTPIEDISRFSYPDDDFEEDEEVQQETLVHFNSVHAKKLEKERKAAEQEEEAQEEKYARLNSLHTARLEEERRAAELRRQLGSLYRGKSDQSRGKFDRLEVADLKQECRDRDLCRKGNRRALMKRLENYESTPTFIPRVQGGYANGYNNIIESIRKPVIKRVPRKFATSGAQSQTTGEQIQDAISRLALLTTEEIIGNSWADEDRRPRRAELRDDPFVDRRSPSPGPLELPTQMVRHKPERSGRSSEGDRERFRRTEREATELRSRLRNASRNSSSSSSRSDFWSSDGNYGVNSRESPPISGNSSERQGISPTEETFAKTFANDPLGGVTGRYIQNDSHQEPSLINGRFAQALTQE